MSANRKAAAANTSPEARADKAKGIPRSIMQRSHHQQGADFADQVASIGKAFSSFIDGMNERSRLNRLEEAYARLPTDEKKAEWDREVVLHVLDDAGKPMKFEDLKVGCLRLGLTLMRFDRACGALRHLGKVKVGPDDVRLIKTAAPKTPPHTGATPPEVGSRMAVPNPGDWRFDPENVPFRDHVILCVKNIHGECFVGEAFRAFGQPSCWYWASKNEVEGEVWAWKPMPLPPASPKGSPCSFPESWGQDLGA